MTSVAREQTAPAQETLEIEPPTEPPRSPMTRASSSCPPGLQSSNDAGPSIFAEHSIKGTCPVPFETETKDDDITEEAEVNEILSQSKLVDRVVWFHIVNFCIDQSQMDLPRDRTDQSQILQPIGKLNLKYLSVSPSHGFYQDSPKLPSRNSSPHAAIVASHSPASPKSPILKSRDPSHIPISTAGQNDARKASSEVVEVQDAEMAPPTASRASPLVPNSPSITVLPIPPSDDPKPNQDHEIPTPIVDDTQLVQSKPSRGAEKVVTDVPAMRTPVTRSNATPRFNEAVVGITTSTPSIEPIQGIASKSTPATPLSEPPTSGTHTEVSWGVEAKPEMKEALRVVVMTRLLCDRQTFDERVNPVLLANLALAPPPDPRLNEKTDPEGVIHEVMAGPRFGKRMQSFAMLRPSLVEFLSQRQALTTNKIQKLRQEYLELHEKWIAHCQALNEQAKPSILEGETVPIGRTTRRSANLGDAVRSDLEMEQILASLESNDATDPNHLSQRNLATIPDMICVTNGRIDYLFDDTCHRVENPAEYYAPQTGIHDWTEEEKRIFLDKYAAYPKQFGIIADYLPNKTASQCVDYYYLHKKGLIDFRKVVSKFGPKRRRRGAGKRKGNALLTDIQKHDEEVHRDSGSPSVAPSHTGKRGRKPRDKDKEKDKDKDKEKANDKDKDKDKDKEKEKEKEGSESKTDGEKKGPGRPPSKRTAAQMQEKTPTDTPTPEPEAKGRRKRGAGTSAVGLSTAPSSRTVSLNLEENEEDTPVSGSVICCMTIVDSILRS